MKFTVILLLVAAANAVDLRTRSKQKNGDERADTREQAGGNSVVDKRAPAISTVSPAITPGVEYADSKESQRDKSPTHQIYATPLPPVSKISDVLSGQGPTFQSAIASHLYAPVSIYQPRLGSPATYEVSAPVPSNLAYTEHRVSLQPSQNSLQFAQKPLQKSKIQQIFVQQPLAYPETLGPIAQPIYQQIPQIHYQDLPINQYQAPLYPRPQSLYQDQQVQIPQQIQPAFTYTQEPQQENRQGLQRELKSKAGSTTAEKQVAGQNHAQPQGPVSFVKFAQLQPAAAPQHQQEIQYQLQTQQLQLSQHQPQQLLRPQPQHQQPEPQYQQQIHYQPQPAQYQLLQQPQVQYQPIPQYHVLPQIEQAQQIRPVQYQLQHEQVQQQSQPQIHYQSQQQPQPLQQQQHQAQTQYQEQPQPQYQVQGQSSQQIQLQPVSKPTNLAKISYIRPGPGFLQSQFPQSHEAPDYRNNVALPTFPPVQYFGKYAQSIFGNHQH